MSPWPCSTSSLFASAVLTSLGKSSRRENRFAPVWLGGLAAFQYARSQCCRTLKGNRFPRLLEGRLQNKSNLYDFESSGFGDPNDNLDALRTMRRPAMVVDPRRFDGSISGRKAWEKYCEGVSAAYSPNVVRRDSFLRLFATSACIVQPHSRPSNLLFWVTLYSVDGWNHCELSPCCK
jgi:hypothetical protein